MAEGGKISWKPWLLRVGGSLVFLGLVLSLVPLDDLWLGLEQITLTHFLLVWFAFAIGHAGAAMKWWALIGPPLPLPVALRAHYTGLAANLCLPTVAGGDAVRATLAYRVLPDMGRIAAAATADRIIDLAALAIIAVTGALASGAGTGLAIAVLAGLAILFFVLFRLLPTLVNWVWTRYPSLPLRGKAESIADAFAVLSGRPALLVRTFGLSVALQGLFIWLAFSLAIEIGVTVAFWAWGFAWAMAKIIAILPVAINGLGLREASLVALLIPFGAEAAPVVAAGLAWQLVLLAMGLAGAVLFALSRGQTVSGVDT